MIQEALKGQALHQTVFEIVARHLDVERYRCFIFGSEASGENWPASDLDIGIMGEQAVDAIVLERIRDELEMVPSLRVFDVVDFADVSAEFRRVALKAVIPFNGKIAGAEGCSGAL